MICRTNRSVSFLMLACLWMTAGGARAQFNLISERQELEAGREADAQIRQKYRISRDREWNGMVEHLGRRLLRISERPGITWTFRVIEAKEINAFSVPGYVYMNTGLLEMLRGDQDAIAGVIAHEIGHTTGRHSAKQMEKAAIGGLLGGLIAGKSRSLGGLVNVAGNLVLLGYSRDDENDADRRAVRYLIRAGYDPEGLVRFFESLNKKEGRSGEGVATYFRTHPATAERIKRVRESIRRERAGEEERPRRRDEENRREDGNRRRRDRQDDDAPL